MILYFSGTGNSEYVAKRIGHIVQDETCNLFQKIRNQEYTEMSSAKPWIIVSPTYGWRIPRILQEWLRHTRLLGSKDIYFVMTCGGSIGNAGAYLEALCTEKDLHYMGCMPILMPENYIALFASPNKEEAMKIIDQAEGHIDDAASIIHQRKDFPKPSVTMKDRLSSGIVNQLYYPLLLHDKKFWVTSSCTSCGLCEKLCPLGNIKLEKGAPVWHHSCTHCMACINHCPAEAIEYGKHTQGLLRYCCPKHMD